MGKHDKKKKKKKQEGVKGTGQEKTELKTEKNAKRKALKMKGDDEDDIEKILEQIKKMDAAKVAINEEVVPHPSPRIHATFTPHPTKDNELLLFGGEFFDGDLTFVYNDLFRYNIDKKEWKKVSSPNSPPPRCSHQAVTYKNFLYIFGGEFTSPSQNQFYHYKDLWRLNLDNYSWEQIKEAKGTPTARSGHRMLRWKNKLLLFGGFYDTIAETKYFNDLYILDLDSLKWTKVEKTAVGQVPKPRSGFIMTLFENTLILYGGYSKEKVTKYGEAKGVIHTDLWSINLNNAPNLTWERLKRSGIPPTPRSGMSAILDKRRLLVFGGVFDEEDETKMNSIFYNDLYALYMDSKRWFSLKLHIKGEKKKRVKKIKDNKVQSVNSTETEDKEDSEDEYQESQLEETTSDFVEDFEDEEEENKKDSEEEDESDQEEEEIEEEEEEEEAEESEEEEDTRKRGKKKKNAKEKERKDKQTTSNNKKEDKKKGNKDKEKKPSNKKEDKKKKEDKSKEKTKKGEVKKKGESKKELPLTLSPKIEAQPVKSPATSSKTTSTASVGPSTKPVVTVAKDTTGSEATTSTVTPPNENAPLIPSPRINSMMCISNNILYMFGGSYEVNNREITLNDFHTLNLNKMDTFVCLRPSDVVEWKGDEEEDDDDEDEDDEDYEDDSDDDEDEESDSSDSENEEVDTENQEDSDKEEAVEEKPKEKKKQVKSKGYIEELKSRLQEFQKDGQPTANAGETLREFFDRTKDYWLKVAYDQAVKEQESSAVNIHHDSKSLIRNGFPLAEQRYKEMKPLLEEFEEIEKESKRQAELLTIKQKGAKPKR